MIEFKRDKRRIRRCLRCHVVYLKGVQKRFPDAMENVPAILKLARNYKR